MTKRSKKPLQYEIKLAAPDTTEGRTEMVRMLRIHGEAMLAMAAELTKTILKDIGATS